MRVAGIGAVAGSLASLEDSFRNTPSVASMAFLVVQHLDPTQKTLLPELLQRYTEMPVHKAEQNMPVRMNTIYMIPPNRERRIMCC
ncbi:chemotaxis protein CheB [Marinobacter sp.]|uniref:chemotaxis protein CheB n=1 Tax=Marinobacter sp. TaxID=50741 RepID=UPI003A94F6FD